VKHYPENPLPESRIRRRQKGFTLVEILVSLAILSIILGALIQTAGTNASNAARLRDRAVAEWVASNRLAELQLAESFPETGSRTGDEEMFGNRWYWKTIVQKVEDEDLRRVDIEVRRVEDDKNPIITIAGFVSHPRLTVRNVADNQ
jgi:general secretion pathway protein I